jgi:DNA-binding response OmpR family regulator
MTELALDRYRRTETRGRADGIDGTLRGRAVGPLRTGVAMTGAAVASLPPTASVATHGSAPTPLEFGGLSIDTDAREVVVDTRVVDLTKLEFDLLAHMAAAPRHVYSRGDLLSEVWHSSPDWQTSKTVTEHVRRIRQKIEPCPGQPRWIRTVPGAGYRFEP